MGWIPFDNRLNENEFYATIGKALFLCQHFERTCKNMFMWFSLTKALSNEQFQFLSQEHRDYVDRLLSLFLGDTIKGFVGKFTTMFSQYEIDTLKSAKDSRNYICHESEIDLIFAPVGPSYKWNHDETKLKQHIGNIVEGDFIVSTCSYEFHEKESGLFKDRNLYVKTLTNWVLRENG